MLPAGLAPFLRLFVFGRIVPLVFASQVVIAVLALVASRVKSPAFQVFVIAMMLAQVLGRGVTFVIEN